MIHPTIGRVVLFRYNKDQAEPFPALVCKVHSDYVVNVGGFMDNGVPFSQPDVPLLQDDDPAPEVGCYAEWMPHQKQQAAGEAAKAHLEPVKL